MKKLILILWLASFALFVQGAVKYWDINGATSGAGGPTPSGTWSASAANWSTDSTGSSATTTIATDGSDSAIFSAGSDATGTYTISVPSGVTVGGIVVKNGTVQKASGSAAVTLGTGSITVSNGAVFSIDGSAAIAASSGATLTLDGATMENRTTGSAGSFISPSIAITVTANGGILSYPTANVLNIIQTGTPGNIISGAGGITKVGAGVLAVATACTYSGPTAINAGEVRIRTTSNRLPTGTDVTVTSPGILNLNGVSQQIGSLAGNGDVGLAGATLTIGGSASTTYSGAIKVTANAGAGGSSATGGSVTKQGNGTITLTGANAFTGLLTLTAGGITVNPDGTLCDPICDLSVNGGTLNLNNATQQIEDLGGTGGTINLTMGHTFSMNVVNSAANRSTTFSGVIAGGGGLLKIGSLTESLLGANTYIGPTVVSVGKLITTTASTGGGSYAVVGGATLGARVGTVGASLNVSDLTLSNLSLNEFDFNYLGFPTAAVVNDPGTIAVNGTTTVNVKGFDTTGTATLLQYSGVRSGPGMFVLGAVPPRVTATLNDDTINNKVILNASGADSLIWVSDATGTWDTNNPANVVWKLANAATPTFYQENSVQGDTVRFDDTATGTATVTLATTNNPFKVTVDNSTTNYTFAGNGKISGTSSLTKSGAGQLLVNTTNDYTGGTTLNAGSIAIQNTSALGTGRLTLNGGNLESDSVTARTLSTPVTLSGDIILGNSINTGDLTLSGAWTISGASRQITVDTVNATISGAIGQDVSGRGLTKAGGGILSLTAANTFSGGIVHNAGTLRVNANTSLGVANSPVSLADGVALSTSAGTGRTLTYAWTVNGNVTLGQAAGGTAAVTLAGTMDLAGGTRTFTQPNGANTVSAVINNGGLIVGSGTLTLSGNNTYSGGTTINSGAAVSLNGSVVTPFGNAAGAVNLAGGNIIVTADRGTTANNLQNPLNLTANTEFQSATTTGTRNLVVGGPITTSGGMLTIHNTETTNGAATFDVRLTNAFTFSSPLAITTDVAGNNAQLSIWNTATVGDQTYSGIISGNGSIRRSVTTANTGGKVTVTAQNTYTGGTSLNDGEIALGSDCTGAPDAPAAGPIGAGTLTLNNDFGKLSAAGAARNLFNHILFSSGGKHLTLLGANDLELSGNVDLATFNITLTNNNTGLAKMSGVISNGSLTKLGAGTLTLTGANTYTGATTISAGTLLVNGSLASANIIVNAGGTLGGSGSVGLVTVTNGGSVNPGASAGILTVTNGLNLSANGTNIWELAANSTSNPGADFDQIALTGGNLVLGGSSRLLIRFIGAATFPDTNNVFWQSSHSWTIIQGSGGAANPGSSNFSAIHGATGNNAGTFSTVADANGNVTLNFTPGASIQPSISPNIVGAGTTSAQLSWSSTPGESYTVQYKTNLLDPAWTDLTNLQVVGSTTTIIDNTTPAPSQRFYRVISP